VLGHRLGTITAAAVAALAMGLAACGGDDSSGASTTDPPRPDSPTTTLAPADQAEADVRAAYDAYWEMFRRLTTEPDPHDPEIDRWATGSVLDDLVDSLTTMQATGSSLRFGPQYSQSVIGVQVEAGRATVRACAVDDGARVSASGDEEPLGLSTSLLVGTLVLDNDSWKVEKLLEEESWDGVHDCSS
jgi:hypothetical protein